jgi:hypothetical protein
MPVIHRKEHFPRRAFASRKNEIPSDEQEEGDSRAGGENIGERCAEIGSSKWGKYPSNRKKKYA